MFFHRNQPRNPHPNARVLTTCGLCGTENDNPAASVRLTLHHGSFNLTFTCTRCNRRVENTYFTDATGMRAALANLTAKNVRTHTVDAELDDPVRRDQPRTNNATRQALETDVALVLAATPYVIHQWCGKYRSEH